MVATTQHATERFESQEIPVDEFDHDPPTVEIPPQTMRALVYGEVRS